LGKGIRNRQRQSCAVQQPTQVTDISHRRNTRGQTTRCRNLGFGQSRPQRGQGATAETEAKKQAICLQSAPALDHLSNRVIRPVQAHRVDYKVKRAFANVQNVGIRHAYGVKISPNVGKWCHNGWVLKFSVNHRQPILGLVPGDLMEKPVVSACTIARQGFWVGKAGRF
jgi:hypothetical protein